ncbi:hypothetical protein [Rubripirellula obstinata]|nr:hypothetical protein [Rubripirellula obstinata]
MVAKRPQAGIIGGFDSVSPIFEKDELMHLSTYFGNLEAAPSLKNDASEAISAAVGHFQSRVRKVNISVRDVNGPKGGEDLCCRCVVHLKRMTPIVIEETGANVRSLINRVADRVSYTLSQKVDRVKQSSRSKKTRKRFAETSLVTKLN